MAIWITRPLDDANRMADAFLAEGIEPFVWPLLHVDFPCPDLGQLPGDVQALIITSRNGLRGAAETSFPPEWLEKPVFAVGEGTATLVRGFGFRDVRVGPGRGEGLVPLVAEAGLDTSLPLVHLRGDEVAFDMKAALAPLGYTLFEAETYRVVEALRLTERAVARLKSGGVTLEGVSSQAVASEGVGGVTLMSPRTARCYRRVMAEAGLDDVMAGLQHFCISEAAAAPLEGLVFTPGQGGIVIAKEPSLAGVMAAIQNGRE